MAFIFLIAEELAQELAPLLSTSQVAAFPAAGSAGSAGTTWLATSYGY